MHMYRYLFIVIEWSCLRSWILFLSRLRQTWVTITCNNCYTAKRTITVWKDLFLEDYLIIDFHCSYRYGRSSLTVFLISLFEWKRDFRQQSTKSTNQRLFYKLLLILVASDNENTHPVHIHLICTGKRTCYCFLGTHSNFMEGMEGHVVQSRTLCSWGI